MSTARSDGDDTLTAEQVSDTIKKALDLLKSIATTGDDKRDEQLLIAEKALRNAR